MNRELSHFTQAVLKNPANSSNTDPRIHITARPATAEQASKGIAQTIHIYFDENDKLDGYRLFDERPVKKEDA
ncbi:hypothetical protein DPSP01_002409 [Paraphaeosphaeria sporulosa]|uniref:Uncharacterized protein n=1 Tax=Paraphaeosphaeria sporulosa TaxID=1460663 RepID=A0A177C128_9PLEO|nr:uncharacterized protein CC84DRAFT_1221657 [Paraphaeosphaeria sporulosa]OAG01126.1 hypothetical protein CC84DRAFT_1221657 [Paraphaeosphaeria sporulosa]